MHILGLGYNILFSPGIHSHSIFPEKLDSLWRAEECFWDWARMLEKMGDGISGALRRDQPESPCHHRSCRTSHKFCKFVVRTPFLCLLLVHLEALLGRWNQRVDSSLLRMKTGTGESGRNYQALVSMGSHVYTTAYNLGQTILLSAREQHDTRVS